MGKMSAAWGLLILLAVTMAGSGCSISASSEASSDSSANSSKSSASSSESSSPESKEASYRDDVRDYTEAFVKANGSARNLQRGLGDVARRHGITNWEDNDATYVGIGRGLARARVTPAQLDGYKQGLSGGDETKVGLILDGYDGETR